VTKLAATVKVLEARCALLQWLDWQNSKLPQPTRFSYGKAYMETANTLQNACIFSGFSNFLSLFASTGLPLDEKNTKAQNARNNASFSDVLHIEI